MLRKYGLWGIGLLLVFSLTYGFLSGTFLAERKSAPKASPTRPNMEVAQKDLNIKVAPQTDIVQKIKYTKCGEEEIQQKKAGPELAGLTLQQIQQVYTGWSIDTFDTREIVLSLNVDDYCKKHSDHMFLGVHEGLVAVFYGEPGPQALLKEETSIPLQDIQPQDRLELEKGIVVKDRSELLQTLEGLQEHRE